MHALGRTIVVEPGQPDGIETPVAVGIGVGVALVGPVPVVAVGIDPGVVLGQVGGDVARCSADFERAGLDTRSGGRFDDVQPVKPVRTFGPPCDKDNQNHDQTEKTAQNPAQNAMPSEETHSSASVSVLCVNLVGNSLAHDGN